MEESSLRIRRVRAFVYMDVYKMGILVGDWLMIGAVAFFGMILNYMIPVTYKRAPVGLIGLILLLGAVYGGLYYLRHGRRRGYINHRLSVFYWRLIARALQDSRDGLVKRLLACRTELMRDLSAKRGGRIVEGNRLR